MIRGCLTRFFCRRQRRGLRLLSTIPGLAAGALVALLAAPLGAQSLPVVRYATLFGGSSSSGFPFPDRYLIDSSQSVAVDSKGSAYVLGITYVNRFPVTIGTESGSTFVVKLDPTGRVVYALRLQAMVGAAIAGDAGGNAYIAGGGTPPGALAPQPRIVKLDPSGNQIYSKYFGGSGSEIAGLRYGDYAHAVAVDAAGNVYLAGATTSPDFPTTADALQPTLQAASNGFLTKLDPTGAIRYSTYLGERAESYAVGVGLSAQGDIYVGGRTGCGFPVTPGCYQTRCPGQYALFVMRLNPTGTRLQYSTYLGGSGYDELRGLALDTAGNAYITGYTRSNDFPRTTSALNESEGGLSQVFVAKLNNSGSALVYSVRFGGSGDVRGIAVDARGDAVVVGRAGTMPAVRALQPSGIYTCSYNLPGRFCGDGFVAKINASGTAFLYSTYLGGDDDDAANAVATDSAGEVYVAGMWGSLHSSWPLSGMGAFAVKIADPLLGPAGLPEAEMRLDLPPGFYVAEVRLAEGQRAGYWSMEVAPAAGLAGGLICGGGIQDSTQPPGWAAFALAGPATVRVQAIAQVLPGGDPAKFSMSARLLDANRNQVGTDQTGTASLQFERSLGAGFYILELRGALNAPLAAFQLGISADTIAGPAYAGGFIVPGLSGFGAFYLPQQQDVKLKASGAPANGPEGAGNLELRLLDVNRRLINSAP